MDLFSQTKPAVLYHGEPDYYDADWYCRVPAELNTGPFFQNNGFHLFIVAPKKEFLHLHYTATGRNIGGLLEEEFLRFSFDKPDCDMRFIQYPPHKFGFSRFTHCSLNYEQLVETLHLPRFQDFMNLEYSQ